MNNYYYMGGDNLVQNNFDIKVDYSISSKNRLSATFLQAHTHEPFLNLFPTGTCASTCGALVQLEPQFALSETWSLATSAVNEFRFGFLRANVPWATGTPGTGWPSKLGLANPGNDTFHGISIGTVIGTGLSGQNGFDLIENQFMPSDTFTWIKGRHIVKFGGEFDKWQTNVQQPWLEEGNFSFAGLATYNPAIPTSTGIGLADFYLGQVSGYSLEAPPMLGFRQWLLQGFFQDDHKIRPNLTINLGFRYQNQPGFTERYNRISDFDPTITNSVTNTPGGIWFGGENGRKALEATKMALFSPRVGFAWTPRAGWVVRGGFGIYMVPWSGNYVSSNPVGYEVNSSLTSADSITPVFTLQQGPPPFAQPSAANRTDALFNGQAISYYPYKVPEGYTTEGQFSIQRQVTENILLDAAYVHTKGTHLGFPRDVDQVPEGLLGPGNAQLNRPYPQYSGIGAALWDGESTYDSFQFSAKKKSSHGLYFTANYTFSKTLDNSSGAGFGFQNSYDPGAMWGLSQLDTTNRVTGSFVYKMPADAVKSFTGGEGHVLNAVAGGWQVSGMLQAQAGVPFTPSMSNNLSGSLAGSWLPNRIGSGKLSNPSVNEWFDPTAFVEPSPYTFGNSGRNILFGPSFWDFDFGLAKEFRLKFLGEGGFFQLRGDFYDVFNHPNFFLPSTSIGSLGVGVITSAADGRNIQLGARIEF